MRLNIAATMSNTQGDATYNETVALSADPLLKPLCLVVSLPDAATTEAGRLFL